MTRRVIPFGAAAILAFVTLALPPENRDQTPILAAMALTTAIIVSALTVPWSRLPAWLQALPPTAFFPVVALLRHAEGGGSSGYSPLLMLPFFWLSLYGTRIQVVLATAASAATLALPILLVGPPLYPATEWRRTIIWLAIGPVIGFTVHALVERVNQLARTDPLTGLPNRRVWEEELHHAMARRRRNEDPISIAILDLDHFKRFNDTRGHQAGDRLLVESAAAWRIALREGDVVARIGGEEFAILMLDATLEMARVAVERVRKATPEEQTTSAGLAEWDREEDVTSLLRRADDALYAAKREGRDRAVSSPSPVSS